MNKICIFKQPKKSILIRETKMLILHDLEIPIKNWNPYLNKYAKDKYNWYKLN